ncbi:uncharacterized protein LOC136063482 [Quercus suber]|uniref:uncharacterized protein LOC136063482 n=1 Tax=Quercus suber TaxID=58331 RepID=UPI0032E00D29
MGFRDISVFNLAMLAKQVWRLIHNEQSLFYRVYKVRYFPNCSFLMEELGSNPSAVWRSLLATREVVREGSTWQIGDGSRIRVTTHKWLPNAPAFLHEPNAEMKVRELIDQSSRQWDRGKLAATFTLRTCKQILSLPLNQLDSYDTLVWTKNKAKTFSVKTAYRVALRLKSAALAEHLSAREHGVTWGKFGSSTYLRRCEHFCEGHAQIVYQQGTTCAIERSKSGATCEFCCQELETVAHIL